MSDLISRQAVKEALRNRIGESISDCINALPSVENKGEWQHDGSRWKNRFICSACGYKLFDAPSNYCPNCGADMRGVSE